MVLTRSFIWSLALSLARDRVLIEHQAQPLGLGPHLVQAVAAVFERVDQGRALGVERLEGDPQPLLVAAGVLDGLGQVAQYVDVRARAPVRRSRRCCTALRS